MYAEAGSAERVQQLLQIGKEMAGLSNGQAEPAASSVAPTNLAHEANDG
jgi:hypothetical protein